MDKVLHDYIDTILGFSFRKYQKSWSDYFDKTFISILSTVLLCTILMISYLGSREYSITEELYNRILQEKYREVLKRSQDVEIQFIYDKKEERQKPFLESQQVIIADFHRKPVKPLKNKISLEEEISSQGILGAVTANMDKYADLPDLAVEELEVNDILIAVKNKSNHGGMLNRIPLNAQKSVDLITDDEFNPWPLDIERQGDTYFQTTDELDSNNREKIRGWRDPEEISIAMHNREQMIEYCFRRESKKFTNLNGYVLVRFIILHTGIIDPASVEIVKSSLFNKRIELCIKNAIKRYRGFESLDKSMGSVAVLQKFIFN